MYSSARYSNMYTWVAMWPRQHRSATVLMRTHGHPALHHTAATVAGSLSHDNRVHGSELARSVNGLFVAINNDVEVVRWICDRTIEWVAHVHHWATVELSEKNVLGIPLMLLVGSHTRCHCSTCCAKFPLLYYSVRSSHFSGNSSVLRTLIIFLRFNLFLKKKLLKRFFLSDLTHSTILPAYKSNSRAPEHTGMLWSL